MAAGAPAITSPSQAGSKRKEGAGVPGNYTLQEVPHHFPHITMARLLGTAEVGREREAGHIRRMDMGKIASSLCHICFSISKAQAPVLELHSVEF